MEDVPLPDVPPEVTNAGDVQAQISEMKEWFKAWTAGDSSVRDYTKYCLLYTSPSPRDKRQSRMPSSA